MTSPGKTTTVLIRRNAPTHSCHSLTDLMPRCCTKTSFLITPHNTCAHRNSDNLHNAASIGYSSVGQWRTRRVPTLLCVVWCGVVVLPLLTNFHSQGGATFEMYLSVHLGRYSWCRKSEEKIWNASRICVSSLRRGHANLLCIVPILVYVLPKQVQLRSFQNSYIIQHQRQPAEMWFVANKFIY